MAYSLANSFAGESLLSGFNWFDGHDPTRGFVSYQNRANAEAKGLFSVDENTGVVRLGVDHTNTYAINEGRPSIRLESKESFNHGLFIADFLHMPPSQCGMWPAFWLYGDNWPNGGEVDIIEGINTAHQNSIAAHTTSGCTIDSSSDGTFSGVKQHLDCTTGDGNIGCGFGSPANATSSYGDGFNAVNGGVYALDWNHEHIRVWHFERGEIPSDIEAKEPDPARWKAPVAVFGGSSCDVDTFFKDMRLVINTNFCGDWGDSVWGKTDQCNAFAPTCSDYVAKSPEAFANAYWDVRYIDRYQLSNESTDVKPPVGVTREAFVADVTVPTNATLAANVTTPNSPTLGASMALPTKMALPAHMIVPTNRTASINRTLPTNRTASINRTLPTNMTLPTNVTVAVTNTSAVLTNRTATGTGSLSSGTAISFIKGPLATQAPPNPAKIGKYAYLGCFGSRTGFQTFNNAKESDDMSLEMCVKLCNGKTFAGVFEGRCLCARALDADTRAMGVEEGAVCDHPCPGNNNEYCGGLRERTAGMGDDSTTMSEQQRFTNVTRMRYVRAPAGRLRRRKLPSTYLLSVYGDVTEPVPSAALAPPPMASGGTGTRPALLVTATAYRTVYPLKAAASNRTVYSVQSATGYRTVYSRRTATVYRTGYPLQAAVTGSAAGMRPYSTTVAMSSAKRMKYGAKPKFTYRDMSTATVYRTVYPLQAAVTGSAAGMRPYPTAVATSSARRMKYGAKPKFTYRDMSTMTTSSPVTSSAAPNSPMMSSPAPYNQEPLSVVVSVVRESPAALKSAAATANNPMMSSQGPYNQESLSVVVSVVRESPAALKSAAATANNPMMSSQGPYNQEPLSVVVSVVRESPAALKSAAATANNPMMSSQVPYNQGPPSAAPGSPESPSSTTNNPMMSSSAPYNQAPPSVVVSVVGKTPAAAAAQQTPSIVTVYIKECDSTKGAESGVTAEPSPTSRSVPPQVPQQMVAGNRVSRPMTLESNSETAPSIPEQVPQGSRRSQSPNSPGSLGSDEKPVDSGVSERLGDTEGPRNLPASGESARRGDLRGTPNPESSGALGSPIDSQGSEITKDLEQSGIPNNSVAPSVSRASANQESPGALESPGNARSPAQSGMHDHSASPGASGAPRKPEFPGALGSPGSSQGSGNSPHPKNLQSPKTSGGTENSKGPGAPGRGNSKGAGGLEDSLSPEKALAPEGGRISMPVLVAAARGIRDTTTLAATLCAAALAVAMVL